MDSEPRVWLVLWSHHICMPLPSVCTHLHWALLCEYNAVQWSYHLSLMPQSPPLPLLFLKSRLDLAFLDSQAHVLTTAKSSTNIIPRSLTLKKLLNLSESQLPYCFMEIIIPNLHYYCRDLEVIICLAPLLISPCSCFTCKQSQKIAIPGVCFIIVLCNRQYTMDLTKIQWAFGWLPSEKYNQR